ncbi:hypothetical protein [Lactococcus lactis]|uniref:hypothetical protein n=1 Tax=Lactococcus lactis TaxID=1358 RepID=UPI0021A2CD8C|nr:hypothetical protein [Lactococcus lactis]MCT3132739.1 hypothetical protein [Lactococcus lactis]
MKFSQVQDVEYLLTQYLEIDAKLVVKFDDNIVIGSFIKNGKSEENIKYRFGDIKFSFDDHIDVLTFKFGRKPDWLISKDEYQSLNELIKFPNKINQRAYEFVIYNPQFLNSNTELRLLIIDPETDFEIIGLAD